MIPGTETAEEKGNTEGEYFREVCGKFPAKQTQIPRVKSKGQCLFLNHEKVGLEGVGNQQKTATIHSPPDIIQPPMAGIVPLHGILYFGQGSSVKPFPLDPIRIKAHPEQPDQELRHFGMIIKRTLNILQPETLRLAVGQTGVTEGDKGVDQCGILTGEKPSYNIVA